MLFKKYGSVAGNNFITKYKGKSNGRLNSYNFEKFVRKPFADKSFHNALNYGATMHNYTAFDHKKLQRAKRFDGNENLAKLPAFNIWRKQLKDNRQTRRNVLSQHSHNPQLLGSNSIERKKLG